MHNVDGTMHACTYGRRFPPHQHKKTTHRFASRPTLSLALRRARLRSRQCHNRAPRPHSRVHIDFFFFFFVPPEPPEPIVVFAPAPMTPAPPLVDVLVP